MDNFFLPPVSIEKFAAYLDGNLLEEEMNHMNSIISKSPQMSEMVDLSDSIDQDIQDYMQDEFLFDADMSILDETDFEIPLLENFSENSYQDVACAATEEYQSNDSNIDDAALEYTEYEIPTDATDSSHDTVEYDTPTEESPFEDGIDQIKGDDNALDVPDINNIFQQE